MNRIVKLILWGLISCMCACAWCVFMCNIVCLACISVVGQYRRMRRGGGAAALPNSGITVGKIRAKQEEKIGKRKLKD